MSGARETSSATIDSELTVLLVNSFMRWILKESLRIEITNETLSKFADVVTGGVVLYRNTESIISVFKTCFTRKAPTTGVGDALSLQAASPGSGFLAAVPQLNTMDEVIMAERRIAEVAERAGVDAATSRVYGSPSNDGEEAHVGAMSTATAENDGDDDADMMEIDILPTPPTTLTGSRQPQQSPQHPTIPQSPHSQPQRKTPAGYSKETTTPASAVPAPAAGPTRAISEHKAAVQKMRPRAARITKKSKLLKVFKGNVPTQKVLRPRPTGRGH